MKTLIINTETTVLSSETAVYKTERFIRETGAFSEFDLFLGKLAESVIQNKDALSAAAKNAAISGAKFPCFKTDIGNDSFFFAAANAAAKVCALTAAQKNDMIFFKYGGKEAFIRKGDKRFSEYLKQKTFTVDITFVTAEISSSDFLKLYRLSNSDYVNFPLLNETQERIVTLEDQNVLVQGVAGSGKTNLCIDKIVFCAGRGYAGRVLYSTFSRGLLADTKGKTLEFCANVKRLIAALKSGSVVFCGGDKIKAVENKLGVYLAAGEDKIIQKLQDIADFLDNKVDYCLIEDLYKKHISDTCETAGEGYFVKTYVKDIKNHQLVSKLSKVAYLSHEVIYKEIYGMISGCCDAENPLKTLALSEYTAKRKDSFSSYECEIIYSLAQDYFSHLQKNKLTDNNLMSRELLRCEDKLPKYSLVILDEVQDMTEVNLVLFKKRSLKMFCVGDALQMINASYFSFAYLKRLLYEKDISSVAELVSNYRNTKKIADIAENLGTLNAKCFGVHSFVLKSRSVDEQAQSVAVFVKGNGFLDALNKQAFNNYTVVVAGQKEKEKLRARLKKQEILTVAEIKGLERDTVILYDLLSSNALQWRAFERLVINRKTADENSVYRYYFNLLYVGVSRAKTRLYMCESENINTFSAFFAGNFEALAENGALENLLANSDKTEAEQDEFLERIKSFISLGQYDNARFTAQKILSAEERGAELNRIEVNERFISKGQYRDAGLEYLRLAMYEDAKRQFTLSGDEELVKLAEHCSGTAGALGLEVLSAFTEAGNNEAVRKVIVGLVKDDLERMRENVKTIDTGLKKVTSNRQQNK